MVYTQYSFENVFQYEQNDVYWCTADIGWITGHSYIIYGPLCAGATTVMFVLMSLCFCSLFLTLSLPEAPAEEKRDPKCVKPRTVWKVWL